MWGSTVPFPAQQPGPSVGVVPPQPCCSPAPRNSCLSLLMPRLSPWAALSPLGAGPSVRELQGRQRFHGPSPAQLLLQGWEQGQLPGEHTAGQGLGHEECGTLEKPLRVLKGAGLSWISAGTAWVGEPNLEALDANFFCQILWRASTFPKALSMNEELHGPSGSSSSSARHGTEITLFSHHI